MLTVNYYSSDKLDYYTYLKICLVCFVIFLITWICLMIAALKIKPRDDKEKSTKTQLWIWFSFFFIIWLGCVFGLHKLNWGFRY